MRKYKLPMVLKPRPKMSPICSARMATGELRIYKSLGSLLRVYRQWREMSQETLAESVGVSVREIQRWEANSRRAHIDSLHDFSEATGIPMQVLAALNIDQPIWYSLRKRRFAYSKLDEVQFIKFFSHNSYKCSQSPEEIIIHNDRITNDKQIKQILSSHRDIYGTEMSVGADVIKAAAKIIPEFNRIVFDHWGHYAGHTVCLPIKMDIYQKLKKHKVFEFNLTAGAMSDIIALHEGVFYFYSIFISNISVAQSIVANVYQSLCTQKIKRPEKYLMVRAATTTEVKEIYDNIGAKVVFSRKLKKEHMTTEIVPTMYEVKLDAEIRRILNHAPFID